MFPGQNSQQPGMGEEAYYAYHEARRIYETGSEVFSIDLAEVCFGSQTELLKTSLVQPAIVAAELANYHMMKHRGLKAELLMGHSLGEIATLGASEAISLNDTFEITKVRARVTEHSSQTNPGGMAALLGFSHEQAARITSSINKHLSKIGRNSAVYVANRNWRMEQVLSGHEEGLDRAKRIVNLLKALKVVDRAAVIKLKVSGAYHSPHNRDGVAELKEALEGVDKKIPRVMLLNNRGQYMVDPEMFTDYYSGQLDSGVDWHLMMHMAAIEGVRNFTEVMLGDDFNKATLSNFVKNEFPETEVINEHFGKVVRINWIPEESIPIINSLTSLQEA